MRPVDYTVVLPPDLVSEIVGYAEFRRVNGFKYDGFYFAPYKKQSRIGDQKSTLLKLFFVILCGRAAVDFKLGVQTDLTSFIEYSFDPHTFGAQDMEYLQRYYAPTSFHTLCKGYLLPFLKFQLVSLRRRLDIDDDDAYKRFRRIEHRFEDAFDVVPPVRPKPEQPRTQVYMTRKEVLQVHAVIHDPLMFPQKWRKFSVEFLTGFFLALRNIELCDLRLEHFVLDDQGFILADEDGFGLLWLPPEISKGGYSGSKRGLGTLVVPRLVVLLNEYFARLYKATPGQFIGKGYVFRCSDKHPESKCSPRSISKWMDTLSDRFEFLGKGRAEALSYYDTRHSVNNLIKKASAHSKETYWLVKRAAEIHLRHNGDIENGDVNDTNYTKEIEPEEYKAIIKATLDFPWDEKGLENWESERQGQDPVVELLTGTHLFVSRDDPSSIAEDQSPPVLHDDELEFLKKERERLLTRPKDMSLEGWTAKLKQIIERLTLMEMEG